MMMKKYSLVIMTFIIILFIGLSFFSCYSLNKNRLSDNILPTEGTEYSVDSICSQIIHCEDNGLEMIHVLLNREDKDDKGKVIFKLLKQGKLIQEWEKSCADITSGTYSTLILDQVLVDSKNQDYILDIYTDTAKTVNVSTNCSGEYSGLQINGRQKEGQSLCYQLVYNHLKDLTVKRSLIRFGIISLLTVILWILAVKLELDISKTFLILWCCFSLLYACSLTLFNIPDEYPHFFRAYDVSLGHLSAVYNEKENAGGNELPFDGVGLTVLEESWQSYELNKNQVQISDSLKFQDFSNTAVYAPISYFPQAIGVFVGRHITKNVAGIAYAGRFANWLCVTLLLMLAFKILPYGKHVLALICLIPMNIHQAISLAPDGMVIALSVLLIAVVQHLIYVQKETLSHKQIIALYVLGICISLYKIVYVPFCLAYVLIPKERFYKGLPGKIFHAVMMMILVGGLSIVWLKISEQFLVIPDTNPDAQTQFILLHPLHYILVLWRTYMNNAVDLLYMMMGRYLGWLTIKTNEILLIVLFILLMWKMNIKIVQSNQMEMIQRTVWTVIVVIIVVLTSTSLYIQFTPAYNDVINGIQGRYFLPLLLPVYLMLTGDSMKNRKKETFGMISSGIVLMTNICICISVIFACFG